MSVAALAAALVPAAPAAAQLPDPAQIVADTGLLPAEVGGAITGAAGDAGGVITGTTTTLDQTLGGILGGTGLLPQDVLGQLLNPVSGGNNAGGGGAPGGVVTGGVNTPGGVAVDARAPKATVKTLSRLKSVGKSGKLRLDVKLSEPGVVALAGTIRPGTARKLSKAERRRLAKVKYSRTPAKIPAVVLAYRQAGTLRVTVTFSRTIQRRLNRSRDARLSLGLVAADVARNQAKSQYKRTVKR